MIIYLLKSSLCLALTFGFYKLWLENEHMHRFKRFYLLGSLLFAISIPLISISIWSEAVSFADESWPASKANDGLIDTIPQVRVAPTVDKTDAMYGLWLYGLVTAAFLVRFVRNLYVLNCQISSHPTRSFREATIVELGEKGLPYAFLNYLFIPVDIDKQNEIESELLTHELTHIRQWHSLDILFIELLLCFGWFNPLLYWFKRAIQLNHEFMADEAVNKTHQNVMHYQRLLLSKLTLVGQVPLTSTLTFQTTKQRLIMMTKHTTPVRTWIAGGCATLLLGVLTLLTGTSTSAQDIATPGAANTAQTRSEQKTDVAKTEQLYGDKFVTIPSRNKFQKATRRKFSDLSASEKQRVWVIPPFPQLTPTDRQLSDWTNSKKYGVWINEKRVPNSQLTNYSAQDFSSVFISKLHRNAIDRNKYSFQVDLMTKPYYQRYVNELKESPTLVLMNRKPVNR